MIIAERKPMEELKQTTAPYKKLLLAGCGTCVTVCWAGGEKEVGILASQLRLARGTEGKDHAILEATVERQCEKEMAEELRSKVAEVDAVLSLACGIGVQTMAEIFDMPTSLSACDTGGSNLIFSGGSQAGSGLGRCQYGEFQKDPF